MVFSVKIVPKVLL